MTDQNKHDVSKENSKPQKKKEKEKRQEEFLKTVDSKLRKEEKDIWFIRNNDHLKI